jgi:hypothetical protein
MSCKIIQLLADFVRESYTQCEYSVEDFRIASAEAAKETVPVKKRKGLRLAI